MLLLVQIIVIKSLHFWIKEKKFEVIATSVVSTFWDLFECERKFCVFIPSDRFLSACIAVEDIESLKLCDEWLNFITAEPLELLVKHYNIDELFANLPKNSYIHLKPYIPLLYKKKQNYNICENIWMSRHEIHYERSLASKILLFHSDHNPSRLSAKISEIYNEEFPIIFVCENMLDYTIVINGGIDASQIRLELSNQSGSLMIQTASQNTSMISSIDGFDIVEYVSRNIEDHEEFTRLINIDEYYLECRNKSEILEYISKYGSVDEIPSHIMEEIISRTPFRSEVFEHIRPLMEYMTSHNIKIASESCLMPLIFPEVKYSVENSDLMSYSENANDFPKEEFLQTLVRIYDRPLISKLYELYISGFVTRDDIINSGLNLIYASCDWMINKIDKVKRSECIA